MITKFNIFLNESNDEEDIFYPHQDKEFISMLEDDTINSVDICEYIQETWPAYWTINNIDPYEVCYPIIKYDRIDVLTEYLRDERYTYFNEEDKNGVYEMVKCAIKYSAKNCLEDILTIFNGNDVIERAVRFDDGWNVFMYLINRYHFNQIDYLDDTLGIGDNHGEIQYSIKNAEKLILKGAQLNDDMLDWMYIYHDNNDKQRKIANKEFFDMLTKLGEEKGQQFILNFFKNIEDKMKIKEVATKEFNDEYEHLFEIEQYM